MANNSTRNATVPYLREILGGEDAFTVLVHVVGRHSPFSGGLYAADDIGIRMGAEGHDGPTIIPWATIQSIAVEFC